MTANEIKKKIKSKEQIIQTMEANFFTKKMIDKKKSELEELESLLKHKESLTS